MTTAATGVVGRASATTIGSAAVPRPTSTEPLARRASMKYATCSPAVADTGIAASKPPDDPFFIARSVNAEAVDAR